MTKPITRRQQSTTEAVGTLIGELIALLGLGALLGWLLMLVLGALAHNDVNAHPWGFGTCWLICTAGVVALGVVTRFLSR